MHAPGPFAAFREISRVRPWGRVISVFFVSLVAAFAFALSETK